VGYIKKAVKAVGQEGEPDGKAEAAAPAAPQSNAFTVDGVVASAEAALAHANARQLATDAAMAAPHAAASAVAATEAAAAPAALPAPKEEAKEDRGVARVSSSLLGMLGRLEMDIAKADEDIGDKMRLLDTNFDGYVSEAELTELLQTVMRTKLTEDEAAAKVRKLMESVDRNGDGQVSVAELRLWVRSLKSKKDVAVHEQSLDSLRKESEEERRARDLAAAFAAQALEGAAAAPGDIETEQKKN
jgi:Ca2+-binding EF-hand superfamily protein